MEQSLKFNQSGITSDQKDRLVKKYKKILEDYCNFALIGEIGELIYDVQREMDREVREIKLDNILKDEFHKKGTEKGDYNK